MLHVIQVMNQKQGHQPLHVVHRGQHTLYRDVLNVGQPNFQMVPTVVLDLLLVIVDQV